MKKHLPILLVLGCVAAFAFGLVKLFELRFETGDVYPPYSSLRADPLGTMGFYESLEKLPGFTPRRDFTTSNRLPDGRNTAYLHLAGNIYEWEDVDRELFGEIERFLARGGRLVITLEPATYDYHVHRSSDDDEPDMKPPSKDSKPEKDKDKNKNKDKTDGDKSKSKSKKPNKKKSDDEDADVVFLSERWGFGFRLINLRQGSNDVFEPAIATNKSESALPRTLAWHSGVVLTNLNEAWRTIYARDTNAVVAERRFGPGSVVIATDSYFVSNEALQRDRHADLLAWLIGSGKNIVFDEAHLGVMEGQGVALLMRKYHLEGLIAGLALLAGLFIWKNSVSLVPPHAHERAEDYVAGRDAASGFVNLLRRSVPPRALLDTCFFEWRKSATQTRQFSPAKIQQAEAVYQSESAIRSTDPIRTYRNISSALSTRKLEPGTRN